MAKKKRGRKPKQQGGGFPLKKEAIISILQIGFFASAALVLVSFSRQAILANLNDSIVSQFGWTSIFIPFILVSFGLLFSKLNNPFTQPNVPVGTLLFFLSLTVLSRSGTFGRDAWEGIATLITFIGAYIVLIGTTAVGLIVLLNTSMDQLFMLIGNILRGMRGTLGSDVAAASALKGTFSNSKKEIKVLGGENDDASNNRNHKSEEMDTVVAPEDIKPQLNNPGDDMVWKHVQIIFLPR